MHDGRTRKVESSESEWQDDFLIEKRASLILAAGPEAGAEWVLEGRRQIAGRSEKSLIRLDEPSVSSEHAAFEVGASGFSVRDLASTNHVFVNEKEVLSQVLSHGDRIRLGECELRYVVEDRPARQKAWSVDTDTDADMDTGA